MSINGDICIFQMGIAMAWFKDGGLHIDGKSGNIIPRLHETNTEKDLDINAMISFSNSF